MTKSPNLPPPPTESREQIALFYWARLQAGAVPELKLMFAVPNGAPVFDPRIGARLKAEGLRPGVPDVCLPVARGGYHGLFIEMKRTKGGTVSPEQKIWLEELSRQGYYAIVARGFEDAKGAVERYLRAEL